MPETREETLRHLIVDIEITLACDGLPADQRMVLECELKMFKRELGMSEEQH